jgi:heptaprenyl diphosphate synthase
MNSKEIYLDFTKTSKMVFLALLISLALILSLIEKMIPMPFLTPGAKLGLANLVIMIAIYTLNIWDAFLVLIIRILLSTLLGSSVSMLLYSLFGGILSFISMILVKKIGGKFVSIIGVSATGAVFHNVGQLFVASLILKNFNVFLYLPVLSIIGIITGIFVGLSANYIINHLKKLSFKNI